MEAAIVRVYESEDYESQIRQAGRALSEGGVVVLPTETLYGAAAALTQSAALARLRQLPPELAASPMTVHLAHREDAMRYLAEVSDFGRRVMRKLWPGPVTLVFDVPLEKQRQVAAELGVERSELYDDTGISLRCPDHPVASEVIRSAGGPVVLRKAPGEQGPFTADAAAESWGDQVDLVLDAGPTKYSRPSTVLKVRDDGYEILRPGIYDRRIIDRLLQTTILFVCSGNTCRSPMAEAIARQLLAKKLGVSSADLEKKGITVLSAGSFAMPGSRAAAAAVEAVKPIGADLSGHRSRPLTVELIHQADVIYTMSRSHSEAVTSLVPSSRDKVVTLDPSGDIADPIGSDVAVYQTLAGQLHTLIEKRLAEKPLP